MVNEEIVGTDIDVNWKIDSEGDLVLTNGRENISQAIYLRLTAYFNSMWWCYRNYGSKLKDWLGKIQNEYTRTRVVQEITETVLKDPRIDKATTEIVDWGASYIGVKIDVVVGNRSYQEYFIFGDLPRVNEDIQHSDYKDTFIETKSTGYYAKRGELLRVHCHVLTMKDDGGVERVPIGKVSLKIGSYFVDIEGNPQEISLSGSEEPGSNTFEFIVPYFIQDGDHDLTFHYHGIRGYNPSSTTTVLHVVDRIPTSTHFIYPKPGIYYYYANDVDDFTDSKVLVTDYNSTPVEHGQVRYYLDEGELSGKYVVIDFPLIFLDDKLLNERVILKIKSEILDCSGKFIFKLNRMFHVHDILTVYCADGHVVDYLEVNYYEDVYLLTSVELIFKHNPEYWHSNSDITLTVME